MAETNWKDVEVGDWVKVKICRPSESAIHSRIIEGFVIAAYMNGIYVKDGGFQLLKKRDTLLEHRKGERNG